MYLPRFPFADAANSAVDSPGLKRTCCVALLLRKTALVGVFAKARYEVTSNRASRDVRRTYESPRGEAQGRLRLAPGGALCYVTGPMKLRLPALKEGVNRVEETLNPAELGLDSDVFHDPVVVTGEADLSETRVDVHLHIETQGHFTCDRCAVEFDRPFRVEDRVLVMLRDAADVEEEEAEGLLFIGTHGSEVDLSEVVAEAVLLDVPLRKLHSEDCKGLCPICYTDWNEELCEHYEQYRLDKEESNDNDREDTEE